MFSYLKEKKIVFALGAVLVLTFAALSPCLQGAFLANWDDGAHLVDYPLVRSLDVNNIKAIFKDTINDVYLPLTTLSFAVEYHFFKYNPFVYHLNNLILHLLITAIIFFLALRLGLSWIEASLASLLFGIHPMHVESVAWVTERKDVLYAFFYVWALHHYLKYIETGRFSQYGATIILGILSLLAKPMALSLVLILLLCDWFKGRKLSWRVLIEKIPFIIYTVPIVWITYRLHMRMPVDSLEQALLVWIWTFIFYLRQFLFPFVLIPVYALPSPLSLANPHYGLSVVTSAVFLGILLLYRRNRWLTFAFSFFFSSIFFLLRTDIQWDMNIVADRFMYLPSLGFCFLFAVSSNKILQRTAHKSFSINRTACMAMLVIFLLFGVKTFLQTNIWKNDEILWNYVIEKIKMKDLAYIAYNNRGVYYLRQNKLALALDDLNRSIQINPRHYYPSYYNRGNVYMRSGYYMLAIEDFTSAVSIKSGYDKAYNNRGLVYAALGEYDKALADYFMCITIKPDEARYYYNRGRLYKKFGEDIMAERDFKRAKELGWEHEDE